jgi:hypothetical protein
MQRTGVGCDSFITMGQSSSTYNPSEDPCNPALQAYLKCVESHKDGLTEGDDCSAEGNLYKDCRKKQLALNKKSTVSVLDDSNKRE